MPIRPQPVPAGHAEFGFFMILTIPIAPALFGLQSQEKG
jgi:hypothetical protein